MAIRMCIQGVTYRCGVAMRVIEGLKSVDTLVAGRAATLKHLNAFIFQSRVQLPLSFVLGTAVRYASRSNVVFPSSAEVRQAHPPSRMARARKKLQAPPPSRLPHLPQLFAFHYIHAKCHSKRPHLATRCPPHPSPSPTHRACSKRTSQTPSRTRTCIPMR
jgi:hypothetical protein